MCDASSRTANEDLRSELKELGLTEFSYEAWLKRQRPSLRRIK